MKNTNFLDQQRIELIGDMVSNKKYKKFFRFTVPILILEVLIIIGLTVFLIAKPKNYCKINTNYDNAVIYVNNEKTNKVKFTLPEQQMSNYYYEFNTILEIEESGTFNVTYKLSCDKYLVDMLTDNTVNNNECVITVQGNTKTELLKAIVIKTDEPLKNFNVYLDVKITKL